MSASLRVRIRIREGTHGLSGIVETEDEDVELFFPG